MTKAIPFLLLSLFLLSCSKKADNHFIRLDNTASIDVPVHFAYITVGISTKGDNIVALDSTGHKSLLKILDVFKNYGVQEVNTRQSQISNYYNQSGFLFNQSYALIFRDLSKYDSFRKDLVAAGAQEINLIQYGSDSLEAYKTKLYNKLLSESKIKATNLASSSGFKLDGILRIIESKESGNYRWDEDSEDFESDYKYYTARVAEPKGGSDVATTISKKTFQISRSLLIYYEISN